MSMTPDTVRSEIELKVVELIQAKVADGSMTEARSQQISQIVLDTLKPGMSWEALYKAIFTLDDTCTELSPIVLPYAQIYEKEIAQKASGVVSNYIKTGQYDAAIKLTDDVVNEDVKLQWSGSGKP
jgi:hypothetical protein